MGTQYAREAGRTRGQMWAKEARANEYPATFDPQIEAVELSRSLYSDAASMAAFREGFMVGWNEAS